LEREKKLTLKEKSSKVFAKKRGNLPAVVSRIEPIPLGIPENNHKGYSCNLLLLKR
jgi:hypothetical protein